MSDHNDGSVGRRDPELMNLDLVAMGFSLDSSGQLIWEETFGADPDNAGDKDFLAACGIAEWTGDDYVP